MKNLDYYRNLGPLTATRFDDGDVSIFIMNQGRGNWRYVVNQDGIAATVGEQFKTKMEAFCALPEYAKQWGFN